VRAILFLLALTCAGCASAPPSTGARVEVAPATSSVRSAAERIDVDFEGQDLADAMEAIGRRVGVNILVQPDVRETIRVSLRDIPWREAVDVIARMTRCEVEERAGGILVLSRCALLSIQFGPASSRTILQLVAAYCGEELRVEPWLELPPLSVDLPDGFGSRLEALLVVARCLDVHVVRQGGLLVVTDRPSAGDPLEPPPARELAPRTGRLTVHARGAAVDQLLRLVAAENGLATAAVGAEAARVDLDADGPPDVVLEALLRAAGARSERVGTTLLVRGATGNALLPAPLVVGAPVVLSATLRSPVGAWALLDDRSCSVGAALLDADGEELDVRLVAIGDGDVTLRANGVDATLRLR
jgi:hypothetical protein